MTIPDIAADVQTIAAVDLKVLAYHTVGPDVTHLEGDTYSTTDPGLLQTVVACGWADLVGAEVAVPDVTGQTEAAATSALTAAGLTVGTVTTATDAVVPAGSVISQTPAGGGTAASGSAVNLVVSTGP